MCEEDFTMLDTSARLLALLSLLPGIIVLAAIVANIYWVTLTIRLRDLLREEDTAVA